MKEKFDYYDSGISAILFIVLQFLFLELYSYLPASIKTSAVTMIASCLLEGMFLLTVFLTAKISKTNMLKATTLDKKVNVKGVLYSIAIAIVFLIFASPLTNVFAMFLDKIGYKSALGGLNVNNVGIYLLYIIVMCAVPAITEESLFRGCMLNGLKEKNKHMAVIVSALFFTFMHGGPDQTIHQFVMGVLAGYILVYTGNIWYPIVIHFTNNFLAVTMSYIYSGAQSSTAAVTETITWGQIGVNFVYAIVMAAAGTAIIYFIIKELIKENGGLQNNDIVITTVGEEKIEESTVLKPVAKTKISWVPIAFFVLSGLYLIFEWVATLLIGLGVVKII